MKRLIVIVLVIILFVLMLSRCTPNQSKSLSIQTPSSSPSPNVVDPTQPSDPAESSPMSTDTPSPSASPTVKPSGSPTATPSVKPSAIATKTASPTPKKSVKPTSSPSEEVIEPETVVKNDNDGDGFPDFVKPTVTFTNTTCEDLGDSYLYTYDVNFVGGDNYDWHGGGRDGMTMNIENGKFWFYPSLEDLSNPRNSGPIYFKIRSVADRSWTLLRLHKFTKKDHQVAVERGAKGVQRLPLAVSDLHSGTTEYFQLPDILYGLCKK